MTLQESQAAYQAALAKGAFGGVNSDSYEQWVAKNPTAKVDNTTTNQPVTDNPFSPTGTNQPAVPTNTVGSQSLQQQIDAALLSGATGAKTGGNTQQVQGSAQSGTFGTSGQENQTQSQTQAENQTATNTGTTAGTQTQTGTNTGTSTAIDTLGLGKLLQGAGGQAVANDTARSGFLNGVIQNGDPGLQSQTSQAVNRALSGPGMVGTGDSARARAAGYAGAEVGRTALGNQLNASQQLAGPTAVTTLAGAGNPFVGQATSGTQGGTTQNVQNTAGTSNTNTLGSTLSSLINNQSQGGTSSANSQQVAAGNTPAQSTSSGGSIICTVLVHHGLMSREVVEQELSYIAKNYKRFKRSAVGYYFFGTPIAKSALKHRWFAMLLLPVAWACSYEAGRRNKKVLKFNLLAWLTYHSFFFTCDKLGWLLSITRPKATDRIVDHALVALLKRYNLEIS